MLVLSAEMDKKQWSSTVGSTRVATLLNSRFMSLDYTEPWHRLLQRPHMGLRFLQYPYPHYYPIGNLPYHTISPYIKKTWNYTFSANRCMYDRGVDLIARRFSTANSVEGRRSNRSNEFCNISDSSHNITKKAVNDLDLVKTKRDITLEKAESEPFNFDVDQALDQLDQHWPELKSSTKLQTKGWNYLQASDGSEEKLEEHVNDKENFPLWTTREIVTDSHDDVTVLNEKQNVIQSSNHSIDKDNGRANKIIKSQAHKTYADVVQQELERPEWHVSGMKLLLNFEREQIDQPQSIQNAVKSSNSFINSYFETNIDEKLAGLYQEMDNDVRNLLMLIGPQKNDLTAEWNCEHAQKWFVNDYHQLIKGKLPLRENTAKRESCEKYNTGQNSPPLFNKEGIREKRNNVGDPDKAELSRAEDIVTYGLDLQTALTITLELWGGQKSRMPYTKNLCSNSQQMKQLAHYSKKYRDWREIRHNHSNVWKLECF